jgi:hypothetical protein
MAAMDRYEIVAVHGTAQLIFEFICRPKKLATLSLLSRNVFVGSLRT